MRDLTPGEITEILRIVGAAILSGGGVLFKLWMNVRKARKERAEARENRLKKIEKDINAAFDRIRVLEEPKCEEKACPMVRRSQP